MGRQLLVLARSQKQERLAGEEKQAAMRHAKTLKRELEWVRMAPRARQAKGKARLSELRAIAREDLRGGPGP